MKFLSTLARIPAAIWRAMFEQAPLKQWAIVLGAPPLCAILVWGLTVLERMVYAPEPVRLEIVTFIADLLKMVVVLVGVIVVALASVNTRINTPAGSLEIDGDDDGK